MTFTEPDGSHYALGKVGPGKCVGECTLLTGDRRSASVYAIRDTVLVQAPGASFVRLIERYPQVGFKLKTCGSLSSLSPAT